MVVDSREVLDGARLAMWAESLWQSTLGSVPDLADDDRLAIFARVIMAHAGQGSRTSSVSRVLTRRSSTLSLAVIAP